MPVVVLEGIACAGKTSTARAIARGPWFGEHATHLLLGEQLTTVPMGAIEAGGRIDEGARRHHQSELVRIVDSLYRIANSSRAEGYNLPCIVLERFYLSLAVRSAPVQPIPADLVDVDDWLCSMDALMVLLTVEPELIPLRLADARCRRRGDELRALERCFGAPGTAQRLRQKQANYQYLVSQMRAQSLVVDTSECAWERYAQLIASSFE